MLDEMLFYTCMSFIMTFVQVFFKACSGGLHRSLQLGPEWTSLTPKPKSLPMGENPSIAPGIRGSGAFHGCET